MKGKSLKSWAFLAIGMAALALSAQGALHAQIAPAYPTTGPGAGTMAMPGGQPSFQPSTGYGSGGYGYGPVRYVEPPIMRSQNGQPIVPPWDAAGPGQYGQMGHSSPSFGYPSSGYYGQYEGRQGYHPAYQAPMYPQPTFDRPSQALIPDASPLRSYNSGVSVGQEPESAPGSRNEIRITEPDGTTRVAQLTSVNGYVVPTQFYPLLGQDSGHHHHNPGLGGYYFGNYSDDFDGAGSYPAVYSEYPGLPEYIFAPEGSVVVVTPQSQSMYVGGYIPFGTDFNNYQVQSLYNYYDLATTQNPFVYHGPTTLPNPNAPPPVEQPQNPDEAPTAPEQPTPPVQPASPVQPEQPATPHYQAGSYKEAFADIESAWINGDIDSIHKHLRNDDLKIAVSLSGKYSYSISSGDWADITRDAFDHLQTVSFEFTELRFQKNGDLTGYAKHVYTVATKDGDKQDTMYVSYTLRHRDSMWYIVAVDTSPDPMIKQQEDQPAGASSDQSAPDKNQASTSKGS